MKKIIELIWKISRTALPYIIVGFLVYIFYSPDAVFDINTAPQTQIKDCIIHAFNEETNEKAAQIFGDTLMRDAVNNSMTLYNCTGEIYSSEDMVKVRSDIATADSTGNLMTFSGNVVLFQEPDTYLYTSELLYNVKQSRIYTYSNVTIDEKDQTTTGQGLESQLKLKRARILNNIKIITK
ncbi:MAG: LPS export ABC transporter periplasmic protein LptC [Candidatus Muiribacteriota bacterium]